MRWFFAPVTAFFSLDPAQIHSGITGKCLDDAAGSTANGAKVVIWDCHDNAPNQAWVFSDGTLQTGGKCLDVTANGTANGAQVEIWDCNGGPNQQWQLDAPALRLVNPSSGRCLDDPEGSTTNGTQLVIWDCHNNAPNQVWLPF